MRLECNLKGDVLIARPLDARIDAASSIFFKNALGEWINKGCKRIVLDLQNVEFVDSSGLGVIISTLKAMEGKGDLVLSGVKTGVMSLLCLTRMNRVFRIYDYNEEALGAIRGGRE
ncbi:MAG: STAS domain-containing protein [Actinomycetota bacterium]|nr:STAS domain-containing protein [Actinomycetota bacterium]